MSDTPNNNGGIGVVGLLQVAFVVLKLTGVIDWTWFWVLAPIWISFGFAVVLLTIAGVVLALVSKGK